MKKKNRVYPPGVKVYFSDDESKQLLERLKTDAQKYKISVSKLIYFAVEYGLGYVEAGFDDMKPKAR